MPFIPLRDGQQLYVRIFGRGQPVLMLPGLGMSSRHWLPFIWPFAHQFQFYMPDFRRAGRSAHLRFNQPDVFQNHYEDTQDVIRHMQLDDFLLVGISLGGTTSLHWQREQGFGGVKRYLHIDQTPCIGNKTEWPYGLFGARQEELFGQMHRLRDVLAEYAHYEQLADLPRAVRQQAASILADIVVLMTSKPWLKPILPMLLTSPKQLSKHLPLTQVQDCMTYLSAYLSGGHDYRDSLRQCHTPITLMVGMQSPLYHPHGQMAIADYAPNVRIVRFHRSGHVPLTDEPLKFVKEFGKFLRE